MVEGKENGGEECTRDGSLDRFSRPALKGKTGGWRSGMLLLGIVLLISIYCHFFILHEIDQL